MIEPSDTHPGAAGTSSESAPSWFSDETSLLGEVRKAVVSLGHAPRISGYDELIRLKVGGQAVVYSALQLSTGRRVALKLIGTDDVAARQRFAREVEVAASLRHPGVVRIYDSGVSADGRVYLVMELIEGPTLERYAANKSCREIAAAMQYVAEAVGYAHQRGVIHRDLKPDNILIDSDGRPRVVDFGLARAVLSNERSITGEGQFVGSLVWSSPEHAADRADAVDTRSDVYCLGVVFFRLLTGQMPYPTSGSVSSVLANIASAEPATMERSTTGELIDADLRTIVLTCLRKDPVGRYQGAAELAADLRRWLAGEPIVAQRETAWRTLNRRARRYRAMLAVVATALAVVSLLAAWSFVIAGRESVARLDAEIARREAEVALAQARAARELAERREQQAGRVAQFLTTVLRSPQPATSRTAVGGKDVKVVEVLSKAAATVASRFENDPAIAASLYMAIGQSYRSLGQVDDAQQQFDLAVRAADQTSDEQIIADALWNKAALIGNTKGRSAEAEPLLRRVLEIRTKAKGGDDPSVLEVNDAIGSSLQGQGRLDEAEGYFRDTLDRRRRLHGDANGDTIASLNNYGSFLRARGRTDDALEYFHAAAKGADEGLGEHHPSALIAWGNYANTLVRLDRVNEALPILQRVVESQLKVNGPRHHHTAGAMNQLAGALQYASPPRKQEAVEMFRRCIESADASIGRSARNTIAFRNNLAVCLSEMGEHAQAIEQLRECVVLIEAERGTDHFDAHAMRGNLGRALMDAAVAKPPPPADQRSALLAESERLLLGAYAGLTKAFDAQHPEATSRAKDLVKLYTTLGRADEAQSWQRLADGKP